MNTDRELSYSLNYTPNLSRRYSTNTRTKVITFTVLGLLLLLSAALVLLLTLQTSPNSTQVEAHTGAPTDTTSATAPPSSIPVGPGAIPSHGDIAPVAPHTTAPVAPSQR